LLFYELALS